MRGGRDLAPGCAVGGGVGEEEEGGNFFLAASVILTGAVGASVAGTLQGVEWSDLRGGDGW